MVSRYTVGVVDVEYAEGGKTNMPLSGDKHMTGRLFYPCDLDGAKNKYSRASWLPHYQYAKGYSHFWLFRTNYSWLVRSLAHAAFQLVVLALGRVQYLDNYLGAPPRKTTTRYPVMVFSHGIGGMRTTYCGYLTELAAHGYVVLAVEHADGSGGVARVAGQGKPDWLWYTGWGTEETRMGRTRHRMRELRTALRVLRALSDGGDMPGLQLTEGLDPGHAFKGLLDCEAAALGGHSYGGGTVVGLVASDPAFKCAIALDPWWGALPADSPALVGWATRSPALLIGSHTWNRPDKDGNYLAGREHQEAVFAAARRKGGQDGKVKGGGVVHLVIEGSTHDSFSDLQALFGAKYRWVIKQMGLECPLPGALGLKLFSGAALFFLDRHLPLSAEQRLRNRRLMQLTDPEGNPLELPQPGSSGQQAHPADLGPGEAAGRDGVQEDVARRLAALPELDAGAEGRVADGGATLGGTTSVESSVGLLAPSEERMKEQGGVADGAADLGGDGAADGTGASMAVGEEDRRWIGRIVGRYVHSLITSY